MDETVEEVWQNFWKGLVCDDDGNVDMEQIKRELYDYNIALDEVPKVYCEITKNTLSKINYKAESVLRIFREEIGDKARAVDCLKDDWNGVTDGCETNEDYKRRIFEYLGIEE